MTNTIDTTIWLQNFKKGDYKATNWLYDTYRTEFVRWVIQKYQCSEEVAIDIFQDSVIAFYKNVRLGKITTLSSSIKTYLFSIGRNLLLKHFRDKKAAMIDIDDLGDRLLDDEQLPYEKMQQAQRSQMIGNLLTNMAEPCRSLILMFYFNRLTIREIKEEMDYSSTDVVKTQKKRCVHRLRKHTGKYYREL